MKLSIGIIGSGKANNSSGFTKFCLRKENMKNLLLKNIKSLYTLDSKSEDKVGKLEGFSVLVQGDRIEKIDKFENLESIIDGDTEIIDCSEKSVLPGFVDPHTHLVFGGDRLDEYIIKIQTDDKEEIEKFAGLTGIARSIRDTRNEGFDGLYKSSKQKLDDLLRNGITTVEIKSGYGIDKEVELLQLEVIQAMKKDMPQTIVATYLGGHDVNHEMGRENYIKLMIEEMIPHIAENKLAERVDVWIEGGGLYSYEETEEIIKAAQEHGLDVTLHSDQYSSMGGGKLAAKYKIASADHLNYLPDDEIEMMKEAGVVGTILPSTDYTIDHVIPADGRHLIDKGLTLALATNLNPGNYCESMQFVMDLACRRHGLTPEEALRGATINAAKALRLEKDYGSIEVGKFADLQIWDTDDFRNTVYRHGMNYVNTVIKHGKIVVKDGLSIY